MPCRGNSRTTGNVGITPKLKLQIGQRGDLPEIGIVAPKGGTGSYGSKKCSKASELHPAIGGRPLRRRLVHRAGRALCRWRRPAHGRDRRRGRRYRLRLRRRQKLLRRQPPSRHEIGPRIYGPQSRDHGRHSHRRNPNATHQQSCPQTFAGKPALRYRRIAARFRPARQKGGRGLVLGGA